ncbi:hypothetical protein STENM327S_01862 [Streptomyces tendae]
MLNGDHRNGDMPNTGQRGLYEGCGDAYQATPAPAGHLAGHGPSFVRRQQARPGGHRRNEQRHAERLLCLLYPATEVPAFRLDQPDTTERDVLRALERVGSRLEIPPNLIAALTQFMRTHTGTDDSPTFSGGHYFRPSEPGGTVSHEQRQLGVVDSYSMSVTLCLATLGFLKVYEGTTTRPEVLKAIAELREATNARLTSAMVSLLRSFSVNVIDAESEQGKRLIQVIGQGGQSDRIVLQQFSRRLRPLRATIIESLSRGIQVDEGIRDESQLFECGWAWGIVKDAPKITDLTVDVPGQPDGIADRLPYVYFTVVALDGIEDLFSDRTLTLGLLDETSRNSPRCSACAGSWPAVLVRDRPLRRRALAWRTCPGRPPACAWSPSTSP